MSDQSGAPFHAGARARAWRVGGWLGCILLLGGALRWYHLGAASLWHDELFSAYFQSLGVRFLWSEGFALESTPPLYYSLLALWTPWAGTSEAALRSMSAVAGLLTVGVVYCLGRELWRDPRVALLGALLFAVAPTSVYYAQEARVYTLLALVVALGMWGIARFLRERASLGALLCYALTAEIALYFHVTAIIYVAAANVAAIGFLLQRRSKRHLVRWVTANAIVTVAALPLLVLILSPGVAADLAHLKPLTVRYMVFAVDQFLTGLAMSTRIGFVLAGLFVAALLAALARRGLWPERRAWWLLVALPSAFLIIAVAISLRRPVLVGRVLSWLWVPLSLVTAHALLGGMRRRLLLGATVLLFGVGLVYQIAWPGWNRDDWRDVLAAVAPELHQADMVVLGPDTLAFGLAYYQPDIRTVRHLQGQAYSTVSNSFIPEHMGIAPISADQLAAFIGAGRHVVLVARGEDLEAVQSLEAQTPPPQRQFDSLCGSGETCFRVVIW